MKKTITTIISIIIAGGLIALAIAMPSKAEMQLQKEQEFKSNFISGCTEDSAGLYNYCSCSYETLEKNLGLDGLYSLATEYESTGVLPNGTIDTIQHCSIFIN